MELLDSSLISFLLVAFGAAAAGTLAGFGSATILTPVAIQFVDVKTAIAMVAFYHLFVNFARLKLFWRAIQWRVFLLFGVPSVVFIVAGALLMGRIPSHWVKMLFGAFLVVYSLLSLLGLHFSLPGGKWRGVVGGVCAGFMAGLIGTAGAIRSAFLVSFRLPKEVYVATSGAIAFLMDLIRLPVYLKQGLIPQDIWPVMGGLVVMAYGGTFVGKKLLAHISQKIFTRVLLLVLGGMGLHLLWSGLSS